MRRRTIPIAAIVALLGTATGASAYPLDGSAATGIWRLEAYRLAVKAGNNLVPPGGRLPTKKIALRLADRPDFTMPAPDPTLTATLRELPGGDAPAYGIAVLDLSDLDAPAYAEHNADAAFSPGSIGKIVVALGFLQALADVYPTDAPARERILRETMVTADAFIHTDEHKVPFWRPGDPRLVARPIVEGDTGNLWTFLDWMLSASSNAAAAMVQKELLLLRRHGAAYPVDPATADAYFTDTSTPTRSADLAAALDPPIARNGLSLARLRQGSFFTKEGKRRVPGTSSHATPGELLRLLVRLEQGRLVDPDASLALKRLLYVTDRRIRYAAAPALDDAAVYFKSGSLYGCRPEAGFACAKYHGNVKNFMNSVAIVETPKRPVPLHYIVVVMSNVLRKDSAEVHQSLATRIHHVMEDRHPIATPARGAP